MSRAIKEEYAMLREEIMETMKYQNSLSAFVATILCTYIGVVIALKHPDPCLYLLPFIVLVPAALKVSDYRERVAYLASYQIVFLEGEDSFLWETRYHKFATERKPSCLSRCQDALETLEFCLWGILCYVLFLCQYEFSCPFPISLNTVRDAVLLCLPFIFICIITRSSFNYWNFRSAIQKDVERWRSLRLDESPCHHGSPASASSQLRP